MAEKLSIDRFAELDFATKLLKLLTAGQIYEGKGFFLPLRNRFHSLQDFALGLQLFLVNKKRAVVRSVTNFARD